MNRKVPAKVPTKIAIGRRRGLFIALGVLVALYWLYIWREGERTELQRAIESHNSAHVRELLAHGADARGTIRDSDSGGLLEQAGEFLRARTVDNTPRAGASRAPAMLRPVPMSLLERAIADNDGKIVSDLLDHGADPNYRGEDGSGLLSRAVTSGCSPEIGEALIRHGAAVNAQNNRGESALHFAAGSRRRAFVRMLLEHGGDTHLRDNTNQTPLHCAARADAPAIVLDLIQHNADIHATDGVGDTPLASAARYRAASTVAILLDHGGDVADLHRIPGDEPLTWIAMRGDMALVRRCWEKILTPAQRAQEGPDALLGAVWRHNLAAIDYFISHGVDVNVDQQRSTMPGDMYSLLSAGGWLPNPGPVHPTARMPLLVAAVAGRDASVARMLIAHGCNPNIPGHPVQTPLGAAAKIAVDGADIPLEAEVGKVRAAAPMPAGSLQGLGHGAAVRNTGAAATAQLRPAPAGVRAARAADKSPSHRSAEWFGVVEALLAAGADARATDVRGASPLHSAVGDGALVQLLLAHGATPDARNAAGTTPLMAACEIGSDAVESLVAAGADVNAMDRRGGTPVMYAVWGPDSARTVAVIRLLVSHGARPDAKDAQGMTALDRLRKLPPPSSQQPHLMGAPVLMRTDLGGAPPTVDVPPALLELLTPSPTAGAAGR